MNGNKATFKKPIDLFRWLWLDEESPLTRDKIEKLPFRTFARVVYNAVHHSPWAHVTGGRFGDIFLYRFFEQHTAVPYPKSCGALVQHQKKIHTRVLLCFRPLDPVETVPRFIHYGDFLTHVVPDNFGKMKLPPPRPVPGCLEQIQTIQEVEEWLACEQNLVRYR